MNALAALSAGAAALAGMLVAFRREVEKLPDGRDRFYILACLIGAAFGERAEAGAFRWLTRGAG